MTRRMKLFQAVIPAAFAVLIAGGALSACSVTSGRESGGDYVDDASLTTKVKTKLAADGGVNLASRVHVETFENIVQLSGFVPTLDDKARAEDIAMRVEGVRAVHNNLVIQ
jgi:hyperosmotically inducible periplasmic protein